MIHKGTQTIETKRLILRAFTPDDGRAAFENWMSDPKVTEFLRWKTHTDISDSRKIVNEWASGSADPEFYQWAIVPKDVNEPIGTISVVDRNDALGIFHIGYCIGSKWWHKGITSEAFSAVIHFLFEEVGANRIESQHDPENTHSGDVMKKCGLTFEGTLRQADFNNRGIVDACVYSILQSEWQNNTSVWQRLYNAALTVQNDRAVSPFIDAGGVAAALLTKKGNIYTGICIDTASTLGMCAERNAVANMLTNGESRIDKIVAVMPDGKVGAPCGACREYMMQLDRDSGDIEILLDLETEKTVRLKDLIPDWWGAERFRDAE